ncbi:FG-GAP-like repeat-containing protein, partial [Hymenobacter persicinus]
MLHFSTVISRRGLRAAGLLTSGTVTLLLAARAWVAAPAELTSPAASALVLPTPSAAPRLAPPTGLPTLTKTAAVPADTSARGMAAVWADVRRRSLFLSADRKTGTLRAGNYAQRLTATFEPRSYTVATPTPGSAALAWQVRFTLRGIGRAAAPGLPLAAGAVTPSTHEGHTSYSHPAFAIDYDNTPAGVRQTFRLAERPTGAGPVAVRLHLATDLHARPAGPGALVFTAGSSPAPVLRYDSLKAWDATGRVLPAHLRLDGPTALALVVDDADATYPVTIDPLASTAGATFNGQNPGDLFATSVALVGDLNGDGYGELAIGAPSFGAGAGMVALYRGSSTGLEPTAATIINGGPGFNFGSSVAGAGDFNGDGYGDLLIGGAGYTFNSNNAGVTYIYGGGVNIFTNPNASAAAIAGFTNSRGGTAVAGVGDVNGDGYDDFATGGPEFDGGGQNNTGSLNIVFGNASLSVTTSAPTLGGAANYRLGASLSGLGDTNGDGYADLIVGAPGVNSALIVRGANTTSFGSFSAFYLTPPNGPSAGTSVAGPGDVDGDGLNDILLGAPLAGTSGSVFIYPGSTTLSANSQPVVVFSTAESGEKFGTAVSGAGDVNGDGYADFVVGAPSFSNTKGRMYITLGQASLTTITNRPQIIEGENAGDQFGNSLSGGDANGDGYGDVVVGAPNYNVGRGRAYAYYGSPADLAAAPTATRTEPVPADNDFFATSLASAGDV